MLALASGKHKDGTGRILGIRDISFVLDLLSIFLVMEQSRQKREIYVKWSENIESFFFKNPHIFPNPRLNWRLVATFLEIFSFVDNAKESIEQ